MRKVILLSLVGLAMILSINYVIGSIYTKVSENDPYVENSPVQWSDLKIALYPNPLIEDRLTIESNKDFLSIEILDVVGKTVYKENFEDGISHISIGFKEFNKGLYIVKINFEGKKYYTEKLLVK
jgi:hypothetical protein